MGLIDPMIMELQNEARSTRKLLERVPESEFGWRPHAKSMTLGRLASHSAEMMSWATMTATTDELDFDPGESKGYEASTSAELLDNFDTWLQQAVAAMREVPDEALSRMWSLKAKGETRFSMPKGAVLRSWVINHLVHHRGQLTVYLRLKDIPLPSIYGPSADER